MDQKILFEIKKFSGKPSALLFTDRNRLTKLLEIVQNLPKNSAIIVREYDLSEKQREKFVQEIRQIVQKKLPSQRPKILMGKDWRLAKKLRLDGVHFSDRDLAMPSQKLAKFLRPKFPKNFLVSYACHNASSACKAQFSKLDLIVISPIFKTKSHFETNPLGQHYLAKIASKKPLIKSKNRSVKNQSVCQKIYALGGVSNENLRSLRKLEIGGFGAINLFGENL